MLDFKDIKFLFKIRYIQKIEKKYQHQGRHHVHFFGEGGGYVNLGLLILDNIRTLMKALKKQNS